MNLHQLIMELTQSGSRLTFQIMKDIESIVYKNPEVIEELDFKAVSELLGVVASHCTSYKKIFKLMNKHGKNLLPLQTALLQGDIESVELLLKKGEKLEGSAWYVNSLVNSMFCFKNIKTRKDMLLLLIKYGFDTRFKNCVGENLLHIFISYFAKNGKPDETEIAEILIKCGNSVNDFDNKGYSLLLTSIYNNDFPMTKVLVENGADVSFKHESLYDDDFPLIAAASQGINFVKLLLSNGADVKLKTVDGWTALHEACFFNNEQLIIFLLRQSVDVNAENTSGETPFSLISPFVKDYDLCINAMIKEFTKLISENRPVSKTNMDLVQTNLEARNYFELCSTELEKMKKIIFYAPHSYYFVLNMSKKTIKKLANLTKNEEFIAKFKENLKSFCCFKNDLEQFFKEAIQVRDESIIVESRLKTIFKDCFPDIVIRILADNLVVEDLPISKE